jgi:uncharacterized protein YndB with AHSA1/START domain
MRPAQTIALILVVGIAGVLAWASTRPDTFRIERRVVIQAPPEAIYSLIDDYRGWALWSPWAKKDPAMRQTYSGADSGLGAVYEWSGNREVGAGRMEIIQAVPPLKLAIDLHFTEPFDAQNTAEFVLEPAGDRTTVSWVMSGPSPYLARVLGLFFSMDEMVGRDFESGLAALKAAAEDREP